MHFGMSETEIYMKRFKKMIKWILIVAVLLVLLLLAVWFFISSGKIRTYTGENSISEKFVMDVNGAPNGLFINGEKDYNCPWELVEEYCEVLSAPDKEFVKIPNAAHSPLWENPQATCEFLRKVKEKCGGSGT